MKKVGLHQVDAFTNVLFGGNPCGVVTDADSLSREEMVAIAREMNLSETAFVLQPTKSEAQVKLRYFTPGAAEIKFCGHATVGSLHQLATLRQYGLDKNTPVKVETNAGVLEMSVTYTPDGKPRATFTAPAISMEPYRLQGTSFAKTLGIPESALLANAEVMIDKELNYVYAAITSLKDLETLQFNFPHIREQFAADNIIAFGLYTNQTIDKASDLHVRGLAPLVGVDEDPFTGSLQGGLITAAKHTGVLDNTQEHIVTEQGHFIGRPGSANVYHNVTTNEIRITAGAVHVFSTELEIA